MKTKISLLSLLIIGISILPMSAFAITQSISVNDIGEGGNNYSRPIDITSDGRYVLFTSYGDNLVANDTNGQQDVFVRDTVNNTTTRVSVDSSGNQANGYSQATAITPDGKYVLFYSSANNLVANDTNGQYDVFVRDTVNNTTTRVSVDSAGNEGNGYSYGTTITPDGRYILFQSFADNLVANDTNGRGDIFVRDTVNNTTTRVSVDSVGNESNNWTSAITITSDGKYVLFHSYADNLVANDTNGEQDVFVRDTVNNTTIRVNVDSAGNESNSQSQATAITSDGKYILFQSYANNLVANDTNGQQDIFVRDTVNNTTTRVSVDSAGNESNGYSYGTSITSDGKYVLFHSSANNLVANDTNGQRDVFVTDTVNNTTTRISVGSSGNESDGYARATVMTPDGRYVLFSSNASNLVADDTNGNYDVFIRDTVNNTTTRVSIDSAGGESNGYGEGLSITPDGRYVLFYSEATNLVRNSIDGNGDVFINERQVLVGVSPTITTPVNGSYRNTTGDISVAGVGLSGADIRVTFLGNQFTTVVSNSNIWSMQLPGQLDGVYTVYAQQKGVGSGDWSATGSSIFTIDTVSPVLPVILTPLQNTLISGGSMYVIGQGEVGGIVTVKVGKTVKVGNIDGLGNWTIGPFDIAPGYKYGIVAKQRDQAGNQSPWTLPRTVYGVKAGTTSVNDEDYKADVLLYKRGVSGSGSSTNTNPSERIEYTLDYLNAGKGYATGVMINEKISDTTCFTVGSITGLNSEYVVEYSNNTGVTYTYTPVGVNGTEDCAVTYFRIRYMVPIEAKSNVVVDNINFGLKTNIVDAGGYLNLPPNPIQFIGSGIGTSLQQGGSVGDFNNDGFLDIVSAGFGGGQTTLYTNTTTGNIINLSISYLGNLSLTHTSTADFDNDGLQDFIGYGYGGASSIVFRNITTGSNITFTQLSVGLATGDGFYGGVTADFNNDGKIDVLGLAGTKNGRILTNTTTGAGITFTHEEMFVGTPCGYGYFAGGSKGDFNNDGKMDAVGYGSCGTTTLFINTTTGSVITFTTSQIGGSSMYKGDVGDFNRDGKLDILGVTQSYTPSIVYTNTSSGGQVSFTSGNIDYNYQNQGGGVVGDFNNDGRDDAFIFGFLNGMRYPIYTNNSGQLIQSSFAVDGGFRMLGGVKGDFNNDGKIDIMGMGWDTFGTKTMLYTNTSPTITTGNYETILSSTGNITSWNKLYVQEETTSGLNKLEYTVYGVSTGSICNTGSVLVAKGQSVNNEINISSITGLNSSICVRVDFSILTGGTTPVLRNIMGTWGNNDIDSIRFNVRVKSGNYSGTTVTNTAYIVTSSIESNTGNNMDSHLFIGLPVRVAPVVTPPLVNKGGFGGGGGGGSATVTKPATTTVTVKKDDTKTIIATNITPQELAKKLEELKKEETKITEVDIKKPVAPTVIITPEVAKEGAKSVEIVASTPNIAIKEAIIQTSYVSAGGSVEVKTVSNPVLETEKKCYTPKEVVNITLGKNKTNKDLLVYQALLKSYDLTIFSDTDSYNPQNGLKRYEAAKMFTNFAKHVLCRESVTTYNNTYTDIANVDSTLRPYIIQAYEYGILKGSNNTFRPLDRMSRKEFVAALMRMFTNENLDILNVGNDWDKNYQELFKQYGLESIVGEDEEIDRYDMSKIIYKLYYNPEYTWTEKGYVLPTGVISK